MPIFLSALRGLYPQPPVKCDGRAPSVVRESNASTVSSVGLEMASTLAVSSLNCFSVLSARALQFSVRMAEIPSVSIASGI